MHVNERKKSHTAGGSPGRPACRQERAGFADRCASLIPTNHGHSKHALCMADKSGGIKQHAPCVRSRLSSACGGSFFLAFKAGIDDDTHRRHPLATSLYALHKPLRSLRRQRLRICWNRAPSSRLRQKLPDSEAGSTTSLAVSLVRYKL